MWQARIGPDGHVTRAGSYGRSVVLRLDVAARTFALRKTNVAPNGIIRAWTHKREAIA